MVPFCHKLFYVSRLLDSIIKCCIPGTCDLHSGIFRVMHCTSRQSRGDCDLMQEVLADKWAELNVLMKKDCY